MKWFKCLSRAIRTELQNSHQRRPPTGRRRPALGPNWILQGDGVRRVRMRGKFPDQSKMDMQETDLFYGGPIPNELSPKKPARVSNCTRTRRIPSSITLKREKWTISWNPSK